MATLVALAAGIGSRYGGLKQVEPVGPSGETLMDYSIYDALRAGFNKVVFVIRRDIERAFREIVGRRFEERVSVEYVFQELGSLPLGFAVPSGRKKPWGTGHAVLMAAGAVREPFAVMNADDFYGADSFAALGQFLGEANNDYAMVGFTLRNTLSKHGSVARGLCRVGAGGYLESVVELTRIEGDGAEAKYTDSQGTTHRLTGDELVSLNLWGFRPTIFRSLERHFEEFLRAQGGNNQAELFIPTVINSMVGPGEVRLKVLPTKDRWLGITYRGDLERVKPGIEELVTTGVYPSKLWG